MTQSSAMEVDQALDRAVGAIQGAPVVALACHVDVAGERPRRMSDPSEPRASWHAG